MTSEVSLDLSGLHWIRREVEENLRQARLVLEDFAIGDVEELVPVIRSLHQVRGALTLARIHGAAMLADELERLARSMNEDRVGSREAAAEVLMLGIAQLPAYLDRIESGEPDIPLILLPLMNDLRTVREAPLVSETSLFAPRLDAQLAAEPVEPGSGNPRMPELVAGLRMDYHRALLKWFRDLDTSGGLKVLRSVVDRVSSAAGTARLRRLLDAAEALLVAIAEGSVQTTPAVKLLYGQLDRVFKRMIEQGEEAIARDFPVELLKNFLYYIARSDSSDPVVLAVRQAADLANSFPDLSGEGSREGYLIGAGRDVFAPVARALDEELLHIKDQLDLYMRGDRHDLERFASLAEPIRRLADTLGMIGQGRCRNRLMPHVGRIRDVVEQGGTPDDSWLDRLAADLLAVQSALPMLSASNSMGENAFEEDALPEGEYRQYLKVALDVVFTELARVKEALTTCFDSGKVDMLEPVPAILHRLSGVFSVLEQPVVSDLFARLRVYVAALLSGARAVPDTGEREILGDLISGIEVYLESLLEPSPDRRRALAVAGEAADRLGLAEPQRTGEQAKDEVPDIAVESDRDGEVALAVDEMGNEQSVTAGDLEDEAPSSADEPEDEIPVASGKPEDEAADAEQSASSVDVAEVAGDESIVMNALEVPERNPAGEAGQSDDIDVAGDSDAATDGSDSSVLDSEILSIFIEEAREELESLQTHFPMWRENPADQEALIRVRRSFHTLKGSGRLVGALEIGETAWAVENLLNRVIDGSREVDAGVIALVDEAIALLPTLIAARESGSAEVEGARQLQTRAESLLVGHQSEGSSDDVAEAPEAGENREQAPEGEEVQEERVHDGDASKPASVKEEGKRGDASESSLLLTETLLTGGDESILTSGVDEHSSIDLDSTLYQIFVREAENHLMALQAFVDRCRGVVNGCDFDDELRRALHTLCGSALTARVASVAGVAEALERWVNLCHRLGLRSDQVAIDLLERSHYVIKALLESLGVPDAPAPSWQALVEEIEERSSRLENGTRQTSGGEGTVEAEADAKDHDDELLSIFVDEARELLEPLESGMGAWEARPDDLLPVVQIQRGLHTIKGAARLSGVTAIGNLSHAMESLLESVAEQRIDVSPDVVHLARQALDVLSMQIDALEQGAVVVSQDALVERLQAVATGKALAAPLDKPGEVPDDGVFQLDLEEDASELDLLDDTELASVDSMSGMLDSTSLTDSQLLTDSELLLESEFASSSPAMLVDESHEGAETGASTRVARFPSSSLLVEGRDAPGPESSKPGDSSKQGDIASGARERVRVRAELLDQLVNNAGEVSIYGARLEQQNKTLGYNLDELARTIGRLREQLRKLEMETEAQILSRHEREHEGELPDGFDPLEMDRYSTIQQLSRALAETTEDLNSISTALQDQSRGTETLLLQQSRVINDLQDGLLRTRMVPVGSRASRLQRVVRQTAEAVGKQAKFTLTGATGEMDRAILERMMGPLEHLLRNAVVHGIEAPDDRLAVGKPPTGKVSLVVSRDGADVVLEVRDDGRGLDRKAIRRKAIERGLLDPKVPVDDSDLDAFILRAGLSTASEVTQVAGRGVGMDVVVNEVKQLGGTLDIESQPGSGTRFIIRLPFTLAISDALLVEVGDAVYVVPHGSLAGITRISRDELVACYRGELFSHGGHDYTVRYLGTLLGNSGLPQVPEGERWVPLLLVHAGEHRVAVQVDRLLGNRQIVVRSLGPQLASNRWVTGGTILADGNVALIVDMGALVRTEATFQVDPEMEAATEEETGAESTEVKVMVVDDSITVRKVTSRLLERHNMYVITARDGVDAVTLLQSERPDVMLLDIEMPRMDGFELARHMRSTEGLKDIPIIMITSRTGDKHRRHAQELGVRRYLGKPYQESELLDNIYTVLAEVRS